MAPRTGPAVIAEGLRKVYRNGSTSVEALRGVDLTVPYGEFLCVVGPRGSGKSTLLHLVGGLETPTSGTISVAGTRIDGLGADAAAVFRRKTIGVVYQFFNLIPTLTIEENIALPLLLDGRRLPQLDSEIKDSLTFFDITPLRFRKPDQLSGGEMQRVALARALIAKPRLILADEPTGNLDSKAGQNVLANFRRTVDERNVALILVTHDMHVTSYADRVLEMDDGTTKHDLRTDQTDRIV